MKVALIFGICGACRSHELKDLEIQDVQDLGSALFVTIPKTKTNLPRSFTIVNTHYKICKRYINLRPQGIDNTTRRFFLNYQHNKCTRQVIGINKFASVPKEIAKFLKLPDSQLYTGHSLRRSSTTLLANTGANMTEIKQHGGWKSSSVAEQYIEDSITNKINRGKKFFDSLQISKENIGSLPPIEGSLSPKETEITEAEVPPASHALEDNVPSSIINKKENNAKAAGVVHNYYNCNFQYITK